MAKYDKTKLIGARGLWAAVLEQAVEDLQGCGYAKNEYLSRSRQLQHESAVTWFKSDSQEPCSFLWICEILDLNPEVVRSLALGQQIQTTTTGSIGLKVIRYRKQNNLSRSQMAAMVGCSESAIYFMESRPAYGTRKRSKYISRIEELVNNAV